VLKSKAERAWTFEPGLAFDVAPTVVAVNGDSVAIARRLSIDLGGDLATDLSLLRADRDRPIVFVYDFTCDLSPVWAAIASGVTNVPILFPSSVSSWPRTEASCHSIHALDEPRVEEFLEACDSSSAVFLNGFGRSDVLLFPGGRICCGPERAVQLRREIGPAGAPACALTGQCYSPGQTMATLPAGCPRLLFTNACASVASGAGMPLGSPWTFFRHVVDSGVGTFVGTHGFRSNVGAEMTRAAALFRSGLPVWQVLREINATAVAQRRETASLTLWGDPFVRYVAPRLASPAGVDVIDVRSPEQTPTLQARCDREVQAWKNWAGVTAVRPADRHQHSIEFDWRQTLASARGAACLAACDPRERSRLQHQLDYIEKLRGKVEQAFIERLARGIARSRPRCLIDAVEERLLRRGRETRPCPRCAASATAVFHDDGWQATRCPNCEWISVHSGQDLVGTIDMPFEVSRGQAFALRTKSRARHLAAGVYRGDVYGFDRPEVESGPDPEMTGVHLRMCDRVSPHVYHARVYAAHDGHVQVVQVGFRVTATPLVP